MQEMKNRAGGSACMRLLLAALLACVLTLAGCSSAPPPANPVVDAPPAPIPTSEPVDWTATMAPYECATGPVISSCGFSLYLLGMESEPTYVHDAGGRDLAGGALTLEWTATTPTTDALKAILVILSGCPDECQANRTLTSAAGPSPLALVVPAYDLDEDQSVAVVVQNVPLVMNDYASLIQEIHLTGTLDFVDDPDGQSSSDEEAADEGA
ncbi:MAG: hypothetical protein QOJ26_1310 [Thermoplasmata archaeon]|nr:hypothetical protein [Thermoplasmata archaeon]